MMDYLSFWAFVKKRPSGLQVCCHSVAVAKKIHTTFVILSVAKNPQNLRHTLNLRQKIRALKVQTHTLNLWILRCAQYDNKKVGMTILQV